MENGKKIFFLILLIGSFWGNFLGCSCALAATVPTPTPALPPTPPAVVPQPVDFGVCTKFFKLDSQKLFYLTLASVNANRFIINEIQSKNGYVVFSVGQKKFLASVIKIDAQNSMLKITPCDNVYYFPIGITQNMFKYVELNFNTPIAKLPLL